MCRRWSKHRPAVRAELGSYAPQRLAFAEILKDNWAANVLAQVTDATTVITTNYDNLAERILSPVVPDSRTNVRARTALTAVCAAGCSRTM